MDSHSPAGQTRIGTARARAAAAKRRLLASALALFLGAMLAARVTHAGHVSQSSRPAGAEPARSADDFSGESGGNFDSGSLAPAQSVPQVATGSS